jgi:hypothetical protein
MYAYMLPDRPWLVKCPKCATLFWVDEAREIGRQEFLGCGKKWHGVVEFLEPSERDYLKFLAFHDLAKEKELYARKRAWWAANDRVRHKPKARQTFSEDQKKNLRALSDLLNETDEYERLMKAEIARELGLFDECLALSSQPFESNVETVASFMRQLARNKQKTVREIPRDRE